MEHREIERLDRERQRRRPRHLAARRRLGLGRTRGRRATLEAAVEHGITFFDTADVYGDGRSEQFCGELRRRHPERVHRDEDGAARRRSWPRTTTARRSAPGTTARARTSASSGSTSSSSTARRTASTRTTPCSTRSTRWSTAGGSRAYGVSVETCAQALAGDRPTARRDRPDHPQLLPPQAARGGAAGGPRGRRRDHRAGPAGIGPAVGPLRRAHHVRAGRPPQLQPPRRGRSTSARRSPACRSRSACAAARELAELVDPGVTLAQFALRWVIDQPGVSTVIPGARNPDQVRGNAASGGDCRRCARISSRACRDVYDRLIREHVHERW